MANLSFLLLRKRLSRNKSSRLLNLLGLTLGISCFLFTLLFVFYERSYDSANLRRSRIYRLVTTVHSAGNDSRQALAFGFISKQLPKQFPEIEQLSRLEIRCAPENTASRRIPLRLGFQHELTLKDHYTDVKGQPMDTMVWALSRHDYEKSPIRETGLRAYDFMGREILF